jgi:hypothetical protein
MPYLQQDTTRLQTELQTLIAQQAPLNAQLATQQQAVTAAQAQRTNAATPWHRPRRVFRRCRPPLPRQTRMWRRSNWNFRMRPNRRQEFLL